MTDASFAAAGYLVLIEDDSNQKFTLLCKSYVPVAYGSKTFTQAEIKMSMYTKEFLAIYFAFKVFGHVFSGAPKSVIILPDNTAVTRFFQKLFPKPCGTLMTMSFISILSKPTSREHKTRQRLLILSKIGSKRQNYHEGSRECANPTNRNQCPISRSVTRRTNLLNY